MNTTGYIDPISPKRDSWYLADLRTQHASVNTVVLITNRLLYGTDIQPDKNRAFKSELDTTGLTLSDLLSFELEEVYLVHNDDLASVVELSNETLTILKHKDEVKIGDVIECEKGLALYIMTGSSIKISAVNIESSLLQQKV